MRTAKSQLKHILDRLPDEATLGDIRLELDDALYALYVQQEIVRGIEASRQDRVTPHAEVKRLFQQHAG